jgi:hypothetical protein
MLGRERISAFFGAQKSSVSVGDAILSPFIDEDKYFIKFVNKALIMFILVHEIRRFIAVFAIYLYGVIFHMWVTDKGYYCYDRIHL